MSYEPGPTVSLAGSRLTLAATKGPEDLMQRRPWYTVLYIQVLIAIALGILVG
jgi:aerobic C4-dicarboxylate transport protein